MEKESIVMLDMTVDVRANSERPNEGWGAGDVNARYTLMPVVVVS